MRRSKIALAVAVGILAAAMPGHALAGGAAQYLVSGRPYSLAPLCRSHGVDGEVSLAIDHHTGRMVAAWMQDIGPTASLTSSIVLTAASTDGGRTWTRTVPSGVMLCERPPGPDDGVFDPSVSVGPDGRWYLARGGAEATPAPGGSSQIFVTTSKDGVHWGRPVLVPAGPTIDFDTLVADPKTAGRAYVTWSNYTTGLPVPDNQVMMSVTSNGGRTFSLPRIVHAAPLGHVDVIAHLVVLSDGSLLTVFGEIPLTVFLTGSGVLTMYATRSTDGGRTWSPTVKVARDPLSDIVDPDHQSTVYEVHCCVFSLAAGPNRSAHLSWSTTHGVDAGDVWVTSSSNAGRTWSAPSDIHRSAQVFQPTLAVSPKAGLALTWYDFTGHTPGASQLLTRLWVARSFDGGATWTIRGLAGPFDMRTAAPVGAGYLGDFQSLVPAGNGFEAAFTLAEPQAKHGPTDIFAKAVP